MAEQRSVTAANKRDMGQTEDYSVRPAVDIFEDASGITLLADMPGVSREGLEIHVDGDGLSISGKADIPIAQDMKALYADMQIDRYHREFTLSSELDAEQISASLKDGVLTVNIPKREELKPRKIEVRAE